jgi:acyl-CoA hydrolase
MMEHELIMRFLAEPGDVNFGGKVHGGAVMKWIDQAGYACAVNWCGGYAVTVYVGGIQFLSPIHIGNMVELHAKLIHTGNTSMHIAVDVYSRKLQEDIQVHNTHCVIIFVSLDENGESTPVKQFVPENDDQKAMQSYAIRLMDLRKNIGREMGLRP